MTTLAHITEGYFSSEPTAISNSGWGTGTRGLCAVITASATSAGTHTVTGGGVTWTTVASGEYASRRGFELFESDGTPNGTDITIDPTGYGGAYQETYYSLDEVAEWSGTGNVVVQSVATERTFNSTTVGNTSVGTITGSQIVYAFVGVESASATSIAGDDVGHTELFSPFTSGGGANVRWMLAIDAGTDIAPAFGWASASCKAGCIAARLSDGAIGSHAVGGTTVVQSMNHYINLMNG